MDPVECGHQGVLAQEAGALEDAVLLFTTGIQLTPCDRPKLASKLLRDRADCYWGLQRKEEACVDMKRALGLSPGIKDEPEKWFTRGFDALEQENFSVAIQCFSFSLLYCPAKNTSLQAKLYALRAEANYRMEKFAEARKDFTRCRKVDIALAKQQGRRNKEQGIHLYQTHSYNKAIVSFGLAKEFIPRSMSELHAQILSYLASCHFSLRQFAQALEAGKEAYKIRPGRSQEEAKRWKERGKQLFKENRFDLLVDCYSLAINYAPTSDRELLAQLLCNRSLINLRNKAFTVALLDAERCVKIRPNWSKAHYRLGSSLAGMTRYNEAMDSFASALELAETEEEKYDTLLQIITIASDLEDGTATIGERLCPQNIIQKAVDDAIAKENWERLRVLFLGGGGPYDACPGEGGLASECDASQVPLELLISSCVNDKKSLVTALLDFGACLNGLPSCVKPPVVAALEREEFEIATSLIQEGADLACLSNQPHLRTKAHALYWKKQGDRSMRYENHTKAYQYYNLALQCAPDQIADMKRECCESLSDICFKRGELSQCIEYGVKGYAEKPVKNEGLVQKWRERGNQLFKDKQYELVIKYYSLAMDYVPQTVGGNDRLSAMLLSNRCAAYLNLKMYDKAMGDAKRCVQIKPDWYKGYYRLGSCLIALGRKSEALTYFCEGLKNAVTEDDRFSLTIQVVNTAMDLKEGTLAITCRIPKPAAQRLIKDVCLKKEWDKLYTLFLGGDSSRSYDKGRGGIATGCNAVIVPVDEVLASSVKDRNKLIAVLLDHGALPSGLHGCKTPPLYVAMEMEDYAMAHMLLKQGADPSAIGCYRGTAAHHRENQGHYWKEEGVKALSLKDYSRAIKLLNLSLQFPNNSADLIYLVNNSLASAYFETKQYIKAVEKGRECFKFKPTKSQIEASKWKERGKKLFTEKEFAILVEYYTLSMQYVPSSDNEVLATLLCNRSLAHYSIGNYQQGLEDAKSCSRFRPEWYKGYVRQGYCHACLDQNRDAVRAFGEGLKSAESDEDKASVLSQIVSLSVNLADGTSSITCSVPNHILEKLIKQLTDKKAWDKLHVVYLGGGGPQRYSPGEGGLATGVNAAEVPIELVFEAGEKIRVPLIVALLENGASANGLKKRKEHPLELAIEAEDYRLVVTLLQYNADPTCIVTKTGDTLLHEALKQLFAIGNSGFFRTLLESDLFDPDVVDGSGNSLFHLVAFGRCSRRKCDVINVLLEAGVNPSLKNTEGRLPVDYLIKKDPRARLIRLASNSYKGGKKSVGAKRKKKGLKAPENKSVSPAEVLAPVQDEDEPEWCRLADDAVQNDEDQVQEVKGKDKKPIPAAPQVKRDPFDKLRANIRGMIENLCPENVLGSGLEAGDDVEDNVVSEAASSRGKEVHDEEQDVPHTVPDIERIQVDEEDDDSNDENLELDLASPFEDLPWEVDCTDQFWKALQNNKVSDSLKRRIVARVRMLAEGRWTKKLCRRVDGLPQKRNIMLFDAKLTRSSRIIWELTVAFSAKCSNDPELRVQAKADVGKVYSEIIRVWDVAADRDTLVKKVESIVKSHDRGQECIVRKELSGFRKGNDKVKNASGERLPNFFVEVAENVDQLLSEKAKSGRSQVKSNGSQFFFPPASPNDMEFHILKFYAVSTALINSVLHSNPTTKLDFPFRVTELEHAIINLQPSQPCPIILLGRSGTGKTTCCLYRLWNEFQSYWEKASTAGPHIPKMVQYLPKSEACGGFAVCEQPNESFVDPTKSRLKEDHDVVLESSSSEEFVRAKDARRKDYEEGDDTVEPSEFEDQDSLEYEHLHQVFITKNPVLCSEVQKNFSELSHACPAAREHVEREDASLPSRIQDIDDAAWPLFINSRDWLLLLDASLPGCEFFPRADDGSLMRKIHGWGEEETHLVAIDEDSDYDEEDPDEADDHEEMADAVTCSRQDPKSFDPRREVTYAVFLSELWPKMTKKVKAQYHPTLVWTEIRSFIKGSIEALHTDQGFLSLEEYSDLGRKRAPNFSADREVVYSLFRIYQQAKCSQRMFDEADVVHHVYSRLLKIQVPDWSIHRFYVDETQDFTQAELSLLIRCSRDPNGLFFTGDTAQSIMRGIAFRFNDLKSLFYYSQQSYQALGFQSGVQVPNRLYQLTHNYRSHAGILRLASSVVDLLLHYFPESFDRLEKDQGLFEGPKPVLLESCSFGDLAMILRGNRRQATRIEFGAHQVILVASEEARAQMPEELKQGLILTIYESKGLEFDDVLIYNFFKDSQAKKEWRVVTTFIKEMADGKVPNSTGLIELTDNDLMTSTRPLEFDADKHKVLNSEFKFLYTAITRARVNVWFFDEDEEARAPVFEYFQKRLLVRVIRMSGKAHETDQLSSMFVEKSTEAEWSQQGHYFYNKELWEVAVKCFTMANDSLMVKKSNAQLKAAEASKLKANPKMMRGKFLIAADQFLQCAMLDEGARCLHNARERLLLAKLNRKLGKFQDAAKQLRKERHFLEASECYEMINDYHQAVEVLCQGNLYEEAIDTLQRYKSLVGVETSKGGMRPPKESRTVERLCHQLAEEHFSCGRLEEMVSVLRRLPSANDRILFLENHSCVQEAVEALIDEGRCTDAGHLLQKNGRFIEAAKFVHRKKFAAECYLSAARSVEAHASTAEKFELIEGPVERALELFEDCNDKNGEAECLLVLAKLNGDAEDAESARALFNKVNNICGEVDACLALFTTTNGDIFGCDYCSFPGVFLTGLERLCSLVLALNKPHKSVAELQRVEICETYFGVFKGDQSDVRCAFVNGGSRFVLSIPDREVEVRGNKLVLDLAVAQRRISTHLCDLAFKLAQNIYENLTTVLNRHRVCPRFLVGSKCSSGRCGLEHRPFSKDVFEKCFDTLCHQIHVNAIIQSFVDSIGRFDSQRRLTRRLLTNDVRDFRACRQFYGLLFPRMGLHVSCLSKGLVRSLRRHSAVKERLSSYAEFLWKSCNDDQRWLSCERFIEVSRVLHLVGEHSKISLLLSVEEKAFASGDVPCDGMLHDKQHGDQSFFRLLEGGYRVLHFHGDVLYSSFMLIRRFMSLVACRSSIPWPSLANMSSIFEHQMTTCLALFARLFSEYTYPVCLPESYLCSIDIWDAVYGSGRFPTLCSIVESSATRIPPFKGIRQVQRLLEFMVQLVSGQVNRHFNLINSAFIPNALDCVQSGETGRVLVLALTMLCNYGRGIPPPCGHLIEALRNVNVHAFLPVPIQEALEAVQRADGVQDVIMALQGFLSRRNERLLSVCWYNRRLRVDEVIVDSFTQLFSARPAAWHPQAAATAIEPPVDIYLPSEFQMPIEYLEEQRRERALERKREEAAVTIQRWYRGTRRQTRGSTHEQPSDLGEAYFERFKVDASACSLCSVQFSHQSGETYQWHIQAGSAHWRILEEFNMYKQLHLHKIWPLFVAERELRDKLNALSGQNRVGSHDFGLDVQRLDYVSARVGECIRDIESRCRWGDTGRLLHEVEVLGSAIKEVQNIVQQDLQKLRQPGDVADGWYNAEEDEDNANDEDILDVCMPKGSGAKGGGGAKGKKKNRGRRGRDKTRFRQS